MDGARRAIKSIFNFLGVQSRHVELSPSKVIFITGCDSGLGFSLAVYCHSLNMTVVSACHNVRSQGALMLQNLREPKRMNIIELDLLKPTTIDRAQQYIVDLLETDSNYELTALVNNAGLMCFGEFEWQTLSQFENQINVNVLGTMRLTKQMLPLLRQHRGRIINITSHCGLQALPALAPYAASKAALRYWNDALRMEMKQYGVQVVNFIPGSFVMQSNISARQQNHAQAMHMEMSEEQKQFYGVYFKRFHEYLKIVSGFKPPDGLQDPSLMLKFKEALTNSQPKSLYIHEPWRYKIYRMLFLICPTPMVDWLCIKFCAMPTYRDCVTAEKHKAIPQRSTSD